MLNGEQKLTMLTTIKIPQLDRLEKFYNSGFHSSFLDHALQKILATQIARDETDLHKLNVTLKEFEQQNKLSTEDFFQLYQKGQIPDTADMMEWNIAYKMKQRIITRIQVLCGIDANA